TVEEHLKDTVDGDEASNIVRVAFGKLIPDEHHRDAARDADQNEASQVCRLAAQKDDGRKEHEDGPDHPVLDEGQRQYPLVAEYVSQLLVADLRQRRKHHDDEPDGNGNVRSSALKAV